MREILRSDKLNCLKAKRKACWSVLVFIMSGKNNSRIKFIDRDSRRIEINDSNLSMLYPLNPIPSELYNALLNLIEGTNEERLIDYMREEITHQPVFITYDFSMPFPVNSANKRVWLTLTDDEIMARIDDLEGLVLEAKTPPHARDNEIRADLYRKLFIDESKIDLFRLGAIELYGSTTYHNILRNPRVTLHFRWFKRNEPRNVGMQINCLAEIVQPGDPFYRYIRLLVYLYGWKFLDLPGSVYPCAYKLWISEVKIKSLNHTRGFYSTSE